MFLCYSTVNTQYSVREKKRTESNTDFSLSFSRLANFSICFPYSFRRVRVKRRTMWWVLSFIFCFLGPRIRFITNGWRAATNKKKKVQFCVVRFCLRKRKEKNHEKRSAFCKRLAVIYEKPQYTIHTFGCISSERTSEWVEKKKKIDFF